MSRSVGVKFRELGSEIDPETGLPCRTYTPVIFERLKKYQQGFRPRPFDGQEFFDTTTGEPIVWYWKSKTGEIKLFDLMGFSPEDGEELKSITPEIVDAFKEQEINRQIELDRLNKPPRPVDPNTYPPFDAATGKPQVWYWRDPNGNYEFFDNQGFHPTTGDELKIVNKGVINAWKQFLIDKKQAEEESKARRERQLQLQREQEIKHQQDLEQRRREEQEATERRAQSGVMCDQAAANPNDRQKSSSVPGVTYDAINLSEALNICRIAVDAFPDEPRFKYQYARALESSDPNAAIKIYGQLTRQRYAASFDNLGSLLLKRENISGAIAAFKNGSQADDPDSMVSLAGLIQRGLFRTPNPTAARFALLSRAAQLGHEGARRAVEEENQIIQQQQQQQQFQQQQQEEMMRMFGGILGGVFRQH